MGELGFILEKPEGLLKLSETKSTSQNTAFDTGKYISFVPPTHDNYELISMYRGNFSIDQNVNLDESDDAYNRITVMASNQTVEEGVTISGSADGQIAMTDANYRETQEVGGVNDVKLVNKGTIALSGSNLLDAATNEVISSTVGMAYATLSRCIMIRLVSLRCQVRIHSRYLLTLVVRQLMMVTSSWLRVAWGFMLQATQIMKQDWAIIISMSRIMARLLPTEARPMYIASGPTMRLKLTQRLRFLIRYN